jgi:hypothetical protein
MYLTEDQLFRSTTKPGTLGHRCQPMTIRLDLKIGIGYQWHRVADGKIGIGFRCHRVADANLTIGWHRPPNCLKSAKFLGNIGCF